MLYIFVSFQGATHRMAVPDGCSVTDQIKEFVYNITDGQPKKGFVSCIFNEHLDATDKALHARFNGDPEQIILY